MCARQNSYPNAHVLTYYLSRWEVSGMLELRTRGVERALHHKNANHWGQMYVDEWHGTEGVLGEIDPGTYIVTDQDHLRR